MIPLTEEELDLLNMCVKNCIDAYEAEPTGDLFKRVWGKVYDTITKPYTELIMPDFTLIPPGTKKENPSLEIKIASLAYLQFLDEQYWLNFEKELCPSQSTPDNQ